MKKIFKVLLVAFAIASIGLAASTVLTAGPVDGDGSATVDGDCIYQTMGYCNNRLTYACKVSFTAEACRRRVCCHPF